MRGERDDALKREDATWDAVTKGEASFESPDPAAAEVIARVHALDDAPPPRAAFVSGLKRDLLAAVTPASLPAAAPLSLNGHKRPVQLPNPIPGKRRSSIEVPLVSLLAAALLVAIVGGSAGALLTDRLFLGGRESGRPPAVPAAMVPSSPIALGLDDILLRVDVTAWESSTAPATPTSDGSSPQGSRIDLFRIQIEPNVPYAEFPVDLGTRLLLVESGEIAVTLDGPAERVPAGGTEADAIGAGSPVTLGPGDALITPGGTHRLLRAVGSDPATALQLIEHRWIQKDLSIIASGPQPEMLARGPLIVTIARGELAPNGVLPALAAGAVAMVEVEAGSVKMARTEGGNTRSYQYRRGGDVVVGADDTSGATEIRNTSTEPTRLLVVLFEPAD